MEIMDGCGLPAVRESDPIIRKLLAVNKFTASSTASTDGPVAAPAITITPRSLTSSQLHGDDSDEDDDEEDGLEFDEDADDDSDDDPTESPVESALEYPSSSIDAAVAPSSAEIASDVALLALAAAEITHQRVFLGVTEPLSAQGEGGDSSAAESSKAVDPAVAQARGQKNQAFGLSFGYYSAHPVNTELMLVQSTCASHGVLAGRNQFEQSKVPKVVEVDTSAQPPVQASGEPVRAVKKKKEPKSLQYVVLEADGTLSFLACFWDVIVLSVQYAITNMLSTRVTQATLDAVMLTSWSKMSHRNIIVVANPDMIALIKQVHEAAPTLLPGDPQGACASCWRTCGH